MGIQGLQSFLESYGQELLLPKDDTQAWLVIDGNALAHHLYKEANILEGHYRSYAKAILAFMDKIKLAGVEVLQICFDGNLPPHKTPIRQERVRRSMKLTARNVGALDAWVPVPGFVSFICQQVLSDAGYPVTTSPEEADLTCARTAGAFARRAGPSKQVFILSQDSDMHLFDLGPAAAYMPLSTVTFADDKISGHAFFYAQTSASLGVDLLQLGTMMGTEGSASKHASARLCISKLQAGHLRQHVIQEEILRSAALFDWIASPVSSTLDVYAQKNKSSGILMELLSTGNLYLPLLLENVKRESIWRCSREIRAQAYHHIQDLLPPRVHQNERGVTEWLRVGSDLVSEFVAATATPTIDIPEAGLSDEAIYLK
ncbi:hypothetical protein BCR37DRAFT_389567 [Protomyces lactucae-debilis]|uniref:Asteroid domain-containing protein n=1 Tax=Protomyces lactucae-debilis TaxID=2754530 RepID=A0A1Y2EW04_PROLT|nr:uncharacterized protein BCR37DRAFT_389567 [Protomyces lactucae-debilis]ORY75738.1 hypothetical protein BCR37DRAFT_389567 [Protomyces lactucae-debilis]